MELEREKAENLVAEIKQPQTKESAKKKYKVTLVSPHKWIMYTDENGNNVRVMGDFNLKSGDYIEI